jgi:sugar diacid utilization regulator
MSRCDIKNEPKPRKVSQSKLVRIAQERFKGEPLETLLPRLVKEKGSIHAAAAELDVAPNAVGYRMKKMGYTPVRAKSEWVLEEATSA